MAEGAGLGVFGDLVGAAPEGGEVFHEVADFRLGEDRTIDFWHAARSAVAFGDVRFLHRNELVVGSAQGKGVGRLAGNDPSGGSAGFECEHDGIVTGGDFGVGLEDRFQQRGAVVFGADLGEVGTSFAAALGADFVATHAGEDRLVVEDFFAARSVAALQSDLERCEWVGIFRERGVAAGEQGFDRGLVAQRGRVEKVELHGGGDFALCERAELGGEQGSGGGVLQRSEGAVGGLLFTRRALGDEVGEDGCGGLRREPCADWERGLAHQRSVQITRDFHGLGNARIL